MKSNHLYEINLDRVWIFQRGSLFRIIGRSKKDSALEHQGLEWEIKVTSVFGEKIYVNLGSVEHFLLDPEAWFMDYYRLDEVPASKVRDEITREVLKLARSEIRAEYFFLHDNMAEYLDLLANDPVARKHIISTREKKNYKDRRDEARNLALSIDARVAAEEAANESRRYLEACIT